MQGKKFVICKFDQARGIFIFSCYTEISYIDLCNSTPSKIELRSDNHLHIKISRHKTHRPTHIPLLKIPLQILEKNKQQYQYNSNDAEITDRKIGQEKRKSCQI